jgi:hypothetical protein
VDSRQRQADMEEVVERARQYTRKYVAGCRLYGHADDIVRRTFLDKWSQAIGDSLDHDPYAKEAVMAQYAKQIDEELSRTDTEV